MRPLRLEQRHLTVGERAASGIPGEPPPEPDVDDRAVEAADRRSAAASESLDVLAPRLRKSSIAVSPGVRASASSQATSRGAPLGEDDNEPVRLGAFARVSTPGNSFSRRWTIFRSIDVIGSSSTGRPRSARCAARTAIVSSVARRRSR